MALRQHRYRITVEHVGTPKEGQPLHEPLVIETGNHDEILGIVERVRTSSGLDPESATALGLGMKLFGEVVMTNRDNPLFEAIGPAMGAFVGAIKARAASMRANANAAE